MTDNVKTETRDVFLAQARTITADEIHAHMRNAERMRAEAMRDFIRAMFRSAPKSAATPTPRATTPFAAKPAT